MLIQLLIKDPEIHKKTWMLDALDNVTIMEVVGRFLLRRGSGYLSQPCLLRLEYNQINLTEKGNAEKTLSELGLPAKGAMIQASWAISAGHVSSKCAECSQIAELVEGLTTTNGKITEDVGYTSKTNTLGRADLKKSSKMLPSKALQKVTKTTGLVDVIDATMKKANTSTCENLSVETFHSLERLVSMAMKAGDIVEQLERLSILRRNGELTDTEFTKAKAKII